MAILVERTTNNFRFPGQYYIEETGLYYNWWRWYKNEVGRYIQKDEIDNYYTPYDYSRQNPVILIDLYGLFCIPLPSQKSELEDLYTIGKRTYLQAVEIEAVFRIVRCLWKRIEIVYQRREIRDRYFCCEYMRDKCFGTYNVKCFIKFSEKISYQYRKYERIIDSDMTTGIVFEGPGGTCYCCTDPWNNKSYCKCE